MSSGLKFLIIDGYPKQSRDEFEQVGISPSWKLHKEILQQHLPDANYDVLFAYEPTTDMPCAKDLAAYAGIIWAGCSVSICDLDNPYIGRQIKLARDAFEVGLVSWGTCWGLQIAAVAAGGEAGVNPKGRAIWLSRKIHLTDTGREHPMFEGKPPIFDGLASHKEIVTKLPQGATLLAGSSFCQVQAAEIVHKNGTFWGTQYHCDFNILEVAKLLSLREKQLIDESFFATSEDAANFVDAIKALAAEPEHKGLRWKLGIDDDVLRDQIRQCEFVNWINKQVLSTISE